MEDFYPAEDKEQFKRIVGRDFVRVNYGIKFDSHGATMGYFLIDTEKLEPCGETGKHICHKTVW